MSDALDKRVLKQMKKRNTPPRSPDAETDEEMEPPIFVALNAQKSIFDTLNPNSGINTEQSVFDRMAVFHEKRE